MNQCHVLPVRRTRIDQHLATLVALQQKAGFVKAPSRNLVAFNKSINDGRCGAMENMVADANLGAIAV